jgi:hypothetical protein
MIFNIIIHILSALLILTTTKMKRIALVIVFCLPILLQAQNSRWFVCPSLGVDMGGAIPFPLSDIPEGSKGTPKLNPSLGLGLEYRVTAKWNLNFEVSYHLLAFSAKADVRSQPFYFDNHQDILYFSGHTSADFELRFLEFPLMAIYNVNPNWSIILGTYYSRILEGSFNTIGTNGVLSNDKTITDAAQLPGPANTSYDFNDYIDVWDAGLLVGYRYNLNHRLYFWGNLHVGFKSIFIKEFDNIDYEMYQLRLNVGVSIALFDNKS